jgi:hypothetical protein
MMPRDLKIQKRIYKILSVLHKGQALIASVGPILSVARSSIVNSQRPNVDVAVALSSQMLPAPFLEKIASVPGDAISPLGSSTAALVGDGGSYRKGGRGGKGGNGQGNGQGGNGQGGKNGKGQPQCNNNGTRGPKPGQRTPRKGRDLMGKPYSLGAEESDDLDTFCKKASKKQGDVFKLLAMEALGLDGASDAGSSSKFSGLFDFLTSGMSGYFCGNFDPSAVTDLVSSQINDNCKKSEVSSKYDSKKKKGESAEDACKRELQAQSDADVAANGGGDSGNRAGYRKGGSADAVMWADVWGPLANGNMFAQTWGLVKAERDHSEVDRLINIAGSFGGGTSEINDDDATVFAQSEVYQDCADDWDACLPTAAWTMNWRARLRRVHSPLDLAATTVERTVSEAFRQVLDQDPVRKVIGGAPFAQYFEDPAGSLLPASIMDPLEDMRNEVAEQGGDAAKWVTEQGRDRASIIH